MCGRFNQHYTWREVRELYGLISAPRSIEPRYNIAPTAIIDVVLPTFDGHALVPMRWGLIPSWWKDTAKVAPSTFNACAETVSDGPMFRNMFQRRRCIIPASGYFEKKATAGGKQLYYITAASGSVLSIAGLWDTWKDPKGGDAVRSCTVIVTSSNAFKRAIHDQMPVLLESVDFDRWLTGSAGCELLKPAPDVRLRMWPVWSTAPMMARTQP